MTVPSLDPGAELREIILREVPALDVLLARLRAADALAEAVRIIDSQTGFTRKRNHKIGAILTDGRTLNGPEAQAFVRAALATYEQAATLAEGEERFSGTRATTSDEGTRDSSLSASTVYCDDCGLDLTLTREQIEALRRFGNPVRRQPCTANASGLHRVSLPASAEETKA